jgi:ribonuclease HI
MPKTKFYAVRKGRQPGIYQTWTECAAQVNGYEGAQYKSFATRAEAEAYLRATPRARASVPPVPASRAARKRSASTDAAPAGDPPQLALYTDGGCLVNPGPGGYAAVILHKGRRLELSGGFRRTTNNRMELMACIAGLAKLGEPCSVTLYTDSQYVVKSLTRGWAKQWRAARWIRERRRVPNADLWAQLLDLFDRHRVMVEWVRGHAGDPENERCHELATKALQRPDLPADEGYERERPVQRSLFEEG